MGFFDSMETIDPAGRTPRFPENAVATIRIETCRVVQGQWGTRYVVEAQVIATETPDVVTEGATYSWTVAIDGPWGDRGLGEVKAFVGACLGLNTSDSSAINAKVTSQLVTSTLEDNGNFLKGRVVKTQTQGHVTKGGNEMVKHTWAPANAEEVSLYTNAPTPALPASAVAVPPPPAAVAVPPAPPPPPAFAKVFPPEGWVPHPGAPGHFYKGQDVKSEAQLRSMQESGLL